MRKAPKKRGRRSGGGGKPLPKSRGRPNGGHREIAGITITRDEVQLVWDVLYLVVARMDKHLAEPYRGHLCEAILDSLEPIPPEFLEHDGLSKGDRA